MKYITNYINLKTNKNLIKNLILNLENYWEKEHLELLKNVYLKYSLNIMLSNKLIKKKEN